VESDVFMLRVEEIIVGTHQHKKSKRYVLEGEFIGDRTGHWLGKSGRIHEGCDPLNLI
jgi:hypothetical protein